MKLRARADEAMMAYNYGKVNLQAEIKVRIDDGRMVRPRAGRILFGQTLPEEIAYFDDQISRSPTR